MTQYDAGLFEPSDTGVQLATDLNGLVASLLTSHKGPARPSYVRPGMMWIDDSGSNWLLKLYDGEADTLISTINPATHAVADLDPLRAMLGTKASKRNRILNPAFQVCQDRATGATIQVSAGSGYAFDGVVVTASGAALLTYSQVAKVTPGGSPTRLRGVVTTTAAVGAANYYEILLPVEGIDVADLQLGTPQARPFSWRMVVNMPAGTYAVTISNYDGTRCYVVPVVISPAEAGTDKLISGSVPGCADGTWIKDASGTGLSVRIILASGANFQTPTANAWVNGSHIATPAISNNLVAGAVYEIADVGLYAGTDLPAWEMPSLSDDYLRCQRYFQLVGEGWTGMEEDVSHFSMAFQFRLMRTTPSLSLRSTSISTRMSNGSGDRVITECSINTPTISPRAGWVYLNCVGGNSPGRFIQDRLGQPIYTANARL